MVLSFKNTLIFSSFLFHSKFSLNQDFQDLGINGIMIVILTILIIPNRG